MLTTASWVLLFSSKNIPAGPKTTCVFEAMSVSTLLPSMPLLLSFVRIFGKIFAVSGGSFAAPDTVRSSLPGIAAAFEKDIANVQEPINFGKSAKEIFLSTEQAFEEAALQNVFLKELKSGARGVIGALADIRLKLSGNDGKIRGKFELKESNLSVAELLGLNFIEAVADENFKPLSPDERINLIGALKPVFLDFKATLLVKKEAGGGFRNLSVKEIRGF